MEFQRVGDTLLLTLHGELDLRCDVRLLAELPPHGAAIAVDLRDVPFMDLTGLRFLTALQQWADEHGAALLTTGWQPDLLRLMETVARARRAFPSLSRYARLRPARELRAALSHREALNRAVGLANARGWEKSAKALTLASTSTPPRPARG
ncbi:STAS domain-containing protein [Streptomyces sp. NPDC002138]|uniref:STAS domain-containing protein n=1 Tax=Streptomyces sp. NPDC002138 TaxID=3154410 RepID=UPI00332EF08F